MRCCDLFDRSGIRREGLDLVIQRVAASSVVAANSWIVIRTVTLEITAGSLLPINLGLGQLEI